MRVRALLGPGSIHHLADVYYFGEESGKWDVRRGEGLTLVRSNWIYLEMPENWDFKQQVAHLTLLGYRVSEAEASD